MRFFLYLTLILVLEKKAPPPLALLTNDEVQSIVKLYGMKASSNYPCCSHSLSNFFTHHIHRLNWL